MLSPDRRPRLLAAFTAAVALCSALPALAAQIKDVRVGVHPKFTRIVFELDGKAGYRVERSGTELHITIEAMSSARSLRASGDVRGVKVEAGTQARANIALRDSGLRVREMILSDPPRIVLDVVKSESEVAAATVPKPAPKPAAQTRPAPKPIAEAKPTPAPATRPAAETKPAPEPRITEAKPSPSTKVEPAPPTPKPIAEVKPSPSPRVEPAPSAPVPSALTPAPRASEPPKPAPTDSASAPAILPAAAPTAEPILPETAKLPLALPSPEPMPPAPPAAVAPTPPAPVAPKPAPVPTAVPTATPSSWIDRLGDPIWLGVIAVVVLSLAAIAMARRRRALPNDLDVTAIADEVEQTSDSGRIPSGGFAMGDDSASAPESSFGGLFDTPISAVPTPAPERSAPPIAMPTPAASEAEESLFDDAGEKPGEPESPGGVAMDTEMDLPVDRRMTQPAARMGGSAAQSAPSPDIARMLQEFERRIATLEARLDESNEAREKLERQVAAQSEELRVQRAAIARTQRALRTMTRGDEDKATEPALRDGETQAKTRVIP
jgi:hypothetical protein